MVDLGLLSRVAGETKWTVAASLDRPTIVQRLAFTRSDIGITGTLIKKDTEWQTQISLHASNKDRPTHKRSFKGPDFFAVADDIALWILDQAAVIPSAKDISRIRRAPTSSLSAFEDIALAIIALEDARGHKAIGHCKDALEKDPQSALAHEVLGNAYIAVGDVSLALASYNVALGIDPDSHIRANLGVLQRKSGNINAAINEYNALLKLYPHYAYVWIQLAAAYNSQREYQKAQASFERALLEDRYVPDAHFGLGIIYRQQDKLDAASSEFRRAIQDYPADIQAYVMLAVIYQLKEQFDDAITTLKDGLKVNPQYGKAHNNLAALYVAKGLYDQAWIHVHEAQRLGFDVAPVILQNLRSISKEPPRKDE